MHRPTNNLFIISSAIGYPVDAEPNRIGSSPRLPGMEREMRRQGTAFLLVAKCLPTHHKVIYIQQLAREHVLWGFITILFSFPFKMEQQRTARRDSPSSHLHGVPQQLPVDPRPNW